MNYFMEIEIADGKLVCSKPVNWSPEAVDFLAMTMD